MWPFSRKQKEEPRRKRTVRRVLMGFIIGGAITSIVGNKVLQERRKHQLGEDKAEWILKFYLHTLPKSAGVFIVEFFEVD